MRRLAIVLLAVSAQWPVEAAAQVTKPEETNVEGVTAEITEATRKEGVLTVKMRLRNTGTSAAKVKLIGASADIDKFYAVSGNTKLLVLKDSKSTPLMVATDNHGFLVSDIKPGGSFLFWAKYPAPPADSRKFTFYTPIAPPIEDVPIAEAK